jgi:hypothetical protein
MHRAFLLHELSRQPLGGGAPIGNANVGLEKSGGAA